MSAKHPDVEGMYMGTVKVGAKGQIVIPKDAREMFNIQPGDTLLLMADVNRGIALVRTDEYLEMMKNVMNQRPEEAE